MDPANLKIGPLLISNYLIVQYSLYVEGAGLSEYYCMQKTLHVPSVPVPIVPCHVRMYQTHWPLYQFCTKPTGLSTNYVPSPLASVTVMFQGSVSIMYQAHCTLASVPYDRISPVRIPPLLSGAALTLHPPSNAYHDHHFHSAPSKIQFSLSPDKD